MLRTALVGFLVLTGGCHQTSEHQTQPDATPDAPVACPAAPTGMCSASEYCSETSVGALVPGATGCIALPAACAATPTCACLLANATCTGGGPGCTDDDHQLVLTCVYP